MADSDFQKEAFAQLTKIQLVFLTIIFVGFAADVSLDKSSLDRARDQLADIKDVALKWKENWLTEAAVKKVGALQGATTPKKFKFAVQPNNEVIIVELPAGEFQVRPLPSRLAALIQEGKAPHRFDQKPSIQSPSSLSDFWSVWDSLQDKISIYTEFTPVDVAPHVYVPANKSFNKTFSKVSLAGIGNESVPAANRLTGHVFQIHPDDLKLLSKFEPTHRVHAKWPLDGEIWSLNFYAKGRSQLAFDGQEALAVEHRRDWHYGRAKDVFDDLYSISANFADLPFEKVKSILDSEAKRYGERLSLLGVSLPTGQLAVWSLLLTTVVYAYFLVNLVGAAQHFQKNGELISYPWIGILPGTSSLIASLVSLCLLPAVFAVVKCLAIYQLAGLSISSKVSLTATAIVLISSTVVVAKCIFALRRNPVSIALRTDAANLHAEKAAESRPEKEDQNKLG